MPDPPDAVEFDQRRGVRLLRRRWLTIAAVTLLLVAIGAAYGWGHRSYSATAAVRVAKPLAQSLPGNTRTATDDQRTVVNETQILQSSALQQDVADRLHRKSVSVAVNPVANADVVDLTASAGTAANAAKIANAYANTYVDQRTSRLDQQIDQAVSEIGKELRSNRARLIALSRPHAGDVAVLRQTIIAHIEQLQAQETEYLQAKQIGNSLPSVYVHATTPHGTSWRASLEYGLIGAALGLLIGIFLASLLERSRPKVIDAADVNGLAPEPVRVFTMDGRGSQSGPAHGAATRSLAGWLLTGAGHQPGRVYLLLAADGNSNQGLLAGLRDHAALFGRRLAIVDSRLDELVPGETDDNALERLLDESTASQDGRSGAALEADGSEPPNGKAALGSATMQDVLRQLSQTNDAVLVDAADVDACLLVANAAPDGAECVITLAPRACWRTDVAMLFDELGTWGVPVRAVIFRNAARFAARAPRRVLRRQPVPAAPVPSQATAINPPELGS